jgi:hypothetical protein
MHDLTIMHKSNNASGLVHSQRIWFQKWPAGDKCRIWTTPGWGSPKGGLIVTFHTQGPLLSKVARIRLPEVALEVCSSEFSLFFTFPPTPSVWYIHLASDQLGGFPSAQVVWVFSSPSTALTPKFRVVFEIRAKCWIEKCHVVPFPKPTLSSSFVLINPSQKRFSQISTHKLGEWTAMESKLEYSKTSTTSTLDHAVLKSISIE